MEYPKDELIKKLEAIAIAQAKVSAIQKKMRNFRPENKYERKVQLPDLFIGKNNIGQSDAFIREMDHKSPNEANVVNAFDKFFDRPSSPTKEKAPHSIKNKNRDAYIRNPKPTGICCIALFFFIVSFFGLLGSEDIISAIVSLIILAPCALTVYRYATGLLNAINEDKKLLESEAEYEKQLERKYKDQLKEYQSQCAAYESAKKEFVANYGEWRKVYLDHLKEEEEIEAKIEKDRLIYISKIKKEELDIADQELARVNDIVASEYLPVINTLIDYIKKGRADNLKEAINLYEENEYRQRQLELQMESEEQRRREEEERIELENRRHREEMSLLERQEAQRRRDEENYRREAEKNERRKEREAAEAAKRAAESRCLSCAKRQRCSLKVSHPQNCSAFEPR